MPQKAVILGIQRDKLKYILSALFFGGISWLSYHAYQSHAAHVRDDNIKTSFFQLASYGTQLNNMAAYEDRAQAKLEHRALKQVFQEPPNALLLTALPSQFFKAQKQIAAKYRETQALLYGELVGNSNYYPELKSFTENYSMRELKHKNDYAVPVNDYINWRLKVDAIVG